MTVTERSILEIPTGYRSAEAASFMAQLDDQSSWMFRDLAGIGVAELEWQPQPGANTIGMLLAHQAIVEVFWTMVGPERKTEFDMMSALGVGIDDDGIPAAADALHPVTLAGKPLSFYQDLHAKAREYAKRAAMALDDAEMSRIFQRTRRNGAVEEQNVRWVLYHMLEHFCGHFGQILLIRHLYRARAGR